LHLLEKEFRRAQRYEGDFSILAVELSVEAENAHLPHIGAQDMDLIVAEAARATLKRVRDADSAGRMGERTFLVLLPETDPKGALILAERLLKDIERDAEVNNGTVHVAAYAALIDGQDPAVSDMAGLLFQIDQHLTAAREKGPNCVIR